MEPVPSELLLEPVSSLVMEVRDVEPVVTLVPEVMVVVTGDAEPVVEPVPGIPVVVLDD